LAKPKIWRNFTGISLLTVVIRPEPEGRKSAGRGANEVSK